MSVLTKKKPRRFLNEVQSLLKGESNVVFFPLSPQLCTTQRYLCLAICALKQKFLKLKNGPPKSVPRQSHPLNLFVKDQSNKGQQLIIMILTH